MVTRVSWARVLVLACVLVVAALAATRAHTRAATSTDTVPSVEVGMDRSNMATEWTLSPPAEPNVYPFNGPYNGPGVFEARRVAVFDGVARLHVLWFRDGFSKETPHDEQLFVDTVTQVHARGLKILATLGPTGSDFDAKDYIGPAASGCQWGTHALSTIKLDLYRKRVTAYFEAVKQAGLSVDAFELGNELDLYCNDADMPKTSEFATHHWQWFLTPDQVQAFVKGYVPFLTTSVELIRQYFPHAKIITFGMGNPTGNSAPLIAALATFTDGSGKTFDYTSLVDGYGTHIYPPSTTTLAMVTHATDELTSQAALLPHLDTKPMWITEWNEAGSAFWSSKKWYFQYRSDGKSGGDLNLADAGGAYPAMTRAQAIRSFGEDVIARLRSQANPVNIGYVFYYSYDSAGKSTMCDDTGFNMRLGIKGTCFSGVINPLTGELLPDVAAAITDRR